MSVFAAETASLSSGWFLENAWLIPVVPAIGFAIILLFGKRLPGQGAEVGIGSMAASLALAVGTTIQWIQRVDSASADGEHAAGSAIRSFAGGLVPRAAADGEHALPYVEPVIRHWTWWQNGGLELSIGQHIDGLAVMLLLIVTFISLLVQIFSTEYVKGDRRYTHFFAAMTLFSAGMLVMVLAESMIQLILGWELMGLCSFMLIGHWWEEEANSRAALKAFFTVRTGDVGLLVGTAVIYFGASEWAEARGSNGFSIQAINGWAASNPQGSALITWGAIALFIAAIGKSGQFPLHTWLPDAMAGPTPVSSLLHSSTMVVAGVFLVARLYPVFFVGLDIYDSGVNLIAVIGGITIIIAAALAFVQNDIKKVLAYSTVSQLGYMMLGLGVGAWLPAVFHIFTHAFFKCCLFLCAGSISHSGSHHSFDMKADMGGLRKHMPITFWTWILSTAALCGVPFFSGFWSKDEIIDNADHNGYPVFFYIGLIGAAMTAAYMVRATYLTFFGEARGAAAGEHAHHDAHDEADLVVVGAGAHAGVVAAADTPVDGHSTAGHGADHHDDHDSHDSHDGDDHGHDDHGPHESPWRITVPLIILAFLAVVSGTLNAPGAPIKTHYFQDWVEPVGIEVPDDGVGDYHLPDDFEASHGTDDSHDETTDDSHDEDAAGLSQVGQFGRSSVITAAVAAAESEGEGPSGCGTDAPHEGMICYWPSLSHAEFKWAKAVPSILLVLFGGLFSLWLCLGVYGGRSNPFAGLTQRNRFARGVHQFLVNKYYLDALYENVIVRFVAHPLANAAYWVNQNIIDAIVNGVGQGGKTTGNWVYRNIDQGIVDGAVNASGTVANEGGEALQPVQSGRVNQYGALLFGAAAVGAIVLIILNV